ncbi:hypothetical protein FB565_006211 [Actinoplanes lutulentus]|uniref:Peptidase YpeB-like protein n=1 Tax=Actinoplanes lutulentus TaxID=1287878 RepID=A0A327Z4V3_9ACTN|nr:hypothetical protein [Actinoplanes lutulentus]MBB2946443.1 hypothetical protein [Actinoplanes lutulentus]RAK25419.1 hypothetical protein B0I29_13429 [Actinoplanes lutulentus]
MTRFRQWAWGLGIATTSAVTAFGVAAWQANAAPTAPTPTVAAEQPRVTDPSPLPEAATGRGSDALTSGEVATARAVALTPQLAAEAEDVTGKAGPEYLSAEVDPEAGGRQAELYFYDYKTEKLVKQVVDLKTGKLAKSFAATGMQPPASEQETKTALELLVADPLGQSLAGMDGLVPTAHIYTAKPADQGASQCGKSRCVQLIVQTEDGEFLSVSEFVVDLSGRTVARLK